MGIVDKELEAGEAVIFKIDRGRTIKHYYQVIAQAVFVFPSLAFFCWRYFSALLVDFPQPTTVDPMLVQLLVPSALLGCMYGPALILVLVSIMDLVHFFTDELALTNRRIIGRGQSRMYWSFRKVDLKLSNIVEIKDKITKLEIHIEGEPPVVISRLHRNKEFVEKFCQLKAGY